jgi:hypothetical protein
VLSMDHGFGLKKEVVSTKGIKSPRQGRACFQVTKTFMI